MIVTFGKSSAGEHLELFIAKCQPWMFPGLTCPLVCISVSLAPECKSPASHRGGSGLLRPFSCVSGPPKPSPPSGAGGKRRAMAPSSLLFLLSRWQGAHSPAVRSAIGARVWPRGCRPGRLPCGVCLGVHSRTRPATGTSHKVGATLSVWPPPVVPARRGEG